MRDQTILCTGGSGTFGSAFIRHALAAGAARVICLSRGEHRQAELAQAINDPRLECWIGDVRDRNRLQWAFDCRPDVVIHAAALKRVEVCEREADEARKTNINGTRNVVELAMRANVPKVLVISSDKACAPETVYGATKAAAEALAISQNGKRGKRPTRVSVVRYGNVLGSQGSFLNTLWQARQTGAAVNITDPTHTRYWWSIEDAVTFVASVLKQMQGSEIFIPKLASSRVMDLARAIAPNSEFQIVGTRGPEKQDEAMISATESAYCWELGDRYVLLPKQGQWFSPEPPEGAVKVAPGFTYSSGQFPMTVSLQEPREGQPCSALQ